MHLICNELSFYPLAENEHIAEGRLRQFLKTFKEAKDKYGFNHIRFLVNTHSQKVTKTQTFYEFISTLGNQTIKNLLIDLCKAPFTDDLEASELDEFFESNYSLPEVNAVIDHAPVGLPVSYIKALPAISLDSHAFWRNRKINVQKVNANEVENSTFIAFNICLEADITTAEFSEWADNCMANLITNEDLLRRYLAYTKYKIVFQEDFLTQFFEWKENDLETFKYLLLLMKDVQLHPFTGGMGRTENLRNRGKEASKRVTQLDRLSYTLENNIVSFIACKGHYDFH